MRLLRALFIVPAFALVFSANAQDLGHEYELDAAPIREGEKRKHQGAKDEAKLYRRGCIGQGLIA